MNKTKINLKSLLLTLHSEGAELLCLAPCTCRSIAARVLQHKQLEDFLSRASPVESGCVHRSGSTRKMPSIIFEDPEEVSVNGIEDMDTPSSVKVITMS